MGGVGFNVMCVADQPLVTIHGTKDWMGAEVATKIILRRASVFHRALAGSQKRGYGVSERGKSSSRAHCVRRLIDALWDWRIANLLLTRTAFLFGFMMRGRFEAALDQSDQLVIGEGEVFNVFQDRPAIGRGLPVRLALGNARNCIEQDLFRAGERLNRSLTFTVGEHDRSML